MLPPSRGDDGANTGIESSLVTRVVQQRMELIRTSWQVRVESIG